MKTRKLIWLISLTILGSLVPLACAHVASTFARPVLKVDGGAPVPPPIPIPWVPTLS